MFSLKSRGLLSQINVVPYVDVMLVLLVVFMITAPLMTQGVIVDLPDVPPDAIDGSLEEPLILSVDSRGLFYLNFGGNAEEPVDERTVLERAAAVVRRNASVPIYVRADEAATHGRVMRGYALLRQSGARHVAVAVEPPQSE